MALTSIVWFCWLPLHCNAVERKVLKVYQISSTKETKQAHQIQSIMLQASWHSKNLHICFNLLISYYWKLSVLLSHPETELSKTLDVRNICATENHLFVTLPNPPFPFNLDVRRKGSEEHSCHLQTTVIFLPSLATLTWCEAMLNVTA